MHHLLFLATLVTLSPRLGLSPLPVTVRAVIEQPSEQWYCPSVEITWTDETRSSRQSDCPAWDEIEEGFRWSEVFRKVLGEGLHVFEVRLKQGKKEEFYRLEIEVH
jgi:hypothetical protein